MTTIISHCIVCLQKFQVSGPNKNHPLTFCPTNFNVFRQYFLPETNPLDPNIDPTLWTLFSFCSSCKIDVDTLSTFQHKLESIQNDINIIRGQISRKITTTITKRENHTDVVSNRLKIVRRDVYSYYKPLVVVKNDSLCTDNSIQQSSSFIQNEFQVPDFQLKEEPEESCLNDDDDPPSPLHQQQSDINLPFQDLFSHEDQGPSNINETSAANVAKTIKIKESNTPVKSKQLSKNNSVQINPRRRQASAVALSQVKSSLNKEDETSSENNDNDDEDWKEDEPSHSKSPAKKTDDPNSPAKCQSTQKIVADPSELTQDPDGIYHYKEFTFQKANGQFKCGTCTYKNLRRRRLVAHIVKSHVTKKPTCDVCKQSFNTEKKLDEHKCGPKKFPRAFMFVHLSGGDYLYKGKWKFSKVEENGITTGFKCSTCGVIKRTHDYMGIHMRDHHIEPARIICEICGYVAHRPGRLTAHQKCHSAVREFLCNYCGRSFKTGPALKNHSVKHENTRFHCEDCDKTFQYPHGLRRHCNLTGHTKVGSRRAHIPTYECSKCHTIYRYKLHLDKHELTCIGHKPAVCLLCGHISTDPVLLQSHMRKNHSQNEVEANAMGGQNEVIEQSESTIHHSLETANLPE